MTDMNMKNNTENTNQPMSMHGLFDIKMPDANIHCADQSGSALEAIRQLRNEINCRIEHGAESGGHLEFVQTKLDEITTQ